MKKIVGKFFLVYVLLFGLIAVTGLAGSEPRVMISEVAWSGTPSSWADEWIELKNTSEERIDLTGWSLSWEETKIDLGKEKGDTASVDKTVIEPGGVFLLERTDDKSVASVKADLIYKGSLSNSGEKLVLENEKGDKVSTVDGSEGWMAGTSSDGEPGYASMELVGGKWKTHKVKGAQKDSSGNMIYGTPGAQPGEKSEK